MCLYISVYIYTYIWKNIYICGRIYIFFHIYIWKNNYGSIIAWHTSPLGFPDDYILRNFKSYNMCDRCVDLRWK